MVGGEVRQVIRGRTRRQHVFHADQLRPCEKIMSMRSKGSECMTKGGGNWSYRYKGQVGPGKLPATVQVSM